MKTLLWITVGALVALITPLPTASAACTDEVTITGWTRWGEQGSYTQATFAKCDGSWEITTSNVYCWNGDTSGYITQVYCNADGSVGSGAAYANGKWTYWDGNSWEYFQVTTSIYPDSVGNPICNHGRTGNHPNPTDHSQGCSAS